ncbi:hypothetical protein WME94_34920 [Sorangium sp. So ce429]
MSASDVQRYKDKNTMLVWSPRSNIDLYGNTAPIALYANLGVPIVLGTDWLPSGSMNMARELSARCSRSREREATELVASAASLARRCAETGISAEKTGQVQWRRCCHDQLPRCD